MTDQPDDPVDLSLLRDDLAPRIGRVKSRVMDRVAEARRRSLGGEVVRLVAKWAWPAALAAAASIAVVVATARREPAPEPFAALVMSRSPAVRWVTEDARPAVGELLAMTRDQ